MQSTEVVNRSVNTRQNFVLREFLQKAAECLRQVRIALCREVNHGCEVRHTTPVAAWIAVSGRLLEVV